MITDKDEKEPRLQKLGGSNYEMVDGQPDIRGWEVKGPGGEYIGEVDELIFDTLSRKVRYIVLDLDDNELDIEDRQVLVPIGIALLDDEDDNVLLPGVTEAQLKALPGYQESSFDKDSEERIRNVITGVSESPFVGGSDNDFYNHHHFDDSNLYKNRITKNSTGGFPSSGSEKTMN